MRKKNKIRSYLVNLIALLTPYIVRTITSFCKYGIISCILLFVHSVSGYLTISECCWIIILSGIIIELIKIIIGNLLNKIKEEENE